MTKQPIHTAPYSDCDRCGEGECVLTHFDRSGTRMECLSDACDRAPAGVHYAADFEHIFDEEERA